MPLVGNETCPLPEDPLLAEISAALNGVGAWAYLVDRGWNVVYMTDDIRLSNGANSELVPLSVGAPLLGPEGLEVMAGWSGAVFGPDAFRPVLAAVQHWMIEDLGGREAVLEQIDPRLADVLDTPPEHAASASVSYVMPGIAAGETLDIVGTAVRVRNAEGSVAGTLLMPKPAVGMAVMGTITAVGDLGHFARMLQLSRPARRPAAILFADLEGSSSLARRLPTAGYFALGRRIVRAADHCVVDAGGMVGRHAGDGVVAFFLSEHLGSESRAASACIQAARELRERLEGVAARSGLEAEDVVVRFGLHWGSTLHIGHVITAARAEVNSLGDEVNEAARIEACATGGRVLASKALIERLEPEDVQSLGLPDPIAYTALGDLPTATEKARRDAPAIAVCEL